MIAKAEDVKRIRCIGYLFQVQDDHRASSGILIAMELIRLIKLGRELPEWIEPRIGLRANLIKTLHPYKGTKDKEKDEEGKDINLRKLEDARNAINTTPNDRICYNTRQNAKLKLRNKVS